MDIITEMEQLYSEYLSTMARLENEQRNLRYAFNNLLGVGARASTDSCNDRFADGLRDCLLQFVKTEPSPEDAAAALRYVLEQGQARKATGAGALMLEAVHGHAMPLVECLSVEDAAAICAWYQKRYPRHAMLPVQKKLWQALKARKSGK